MTDYNFKPKRTREGNGWHSKKLPHFDGPQQTQFLTFRLFDSMPQELPDKWRSESQNQAQFRRKIEKYLDSGYGECWLKQARIAEMIRESLLFHDGKKYRLISWVIMPNHAHVLLTLLANNHLPEIEHSIKSYTAQQANKLLGRKGQFWQHESFDRYIRDRRHYAAVVRYIENNPVKAGLCASPHDWRFSSAWEPRAGTPE